MHGLKYLCLKERVDKIVNTIMEKAHTGTSSDGIVVVLPVESIYRIKTKTPVEQSN